MQRVRGRFHRGKRDVDMTQGSIVRHLVSFALPLLVGNIFQQLYNTVDAWVVGNYVSSEAFSAVGTVGPVVNLLIGFFTGLASGAGVVISQYYGAKRYDRVQQTVHTAMVMTLILGVLFTGVGIAMTPAMLRLMNTPVEVIPESSAYLTIYFAGVTGLMIYNMGAGILRAVGDSRRPFYFLVVSAVVNTVLDLVFVLGFRFGVTGVAYATILAQAISAVLVLLTLARSNTCIQLRLKKLAICWEMFWKIIRVGIPAAIQMAVTAFSNVFVQSYINSFGADCMAGWTVHSKLDQLILLPMQSLALAATTFVGQNLGCNQEDRARQGIGVTMRLSLGATVILMIPVLIFAPQLVRFFNDKPGVLEYGVLVLRWVCPFYVLCCVNQVLAGVLRGAGNSRAPMIIMLCSFVLFRQGYLYTVSALLPGQVIPVILGYPAGWLVCSGVMLLYYKTTKLTKTRLVEE